MPSSFWMWYEKDKVLSEYVHSDTCFECVLATKIVIL